MADKIQISREGIEYEIIDQFPIFTLNKCIIGNYVLSSHQNAIGEIYMSGHPHSAVHGVYKAIKWIGNKREDDILITDEDVRSLPEILSVKIHSMPDYLTRKTVSKQDIIRMIKLGLQYHKNLTSRELEELTESAEMIYKTYMKQK